MKRKMMLLEDDRGLIDGLTYALSKEGYEVVVTQTIAEALKTLAAQQFEMLLLDVTLPDGTGFDLCKDIRESGNRVPIIFLTASDQELSVIRGLDSGGDDYITKPFKIGELQSRIRALLRRAEQRGLVPSEAEPIVSGDIHVDLVNHQVLRSGEPLNLTAAEYRLLVLFLRHAGQVLTRQKILEALWDHAGDFVDDNTLSVYVRRLREKVELNPSKPERLVTVRGFGYQWQEVAR
ncbi:MAG: two-component system, OmpR family, response regulator RegX3 [Clostridiales bacterium]|jgi:DNA-binding response OmpR family regulator|nr:two-component system, OmpR family, response regulator RegX3 [Clostridiales bacterium]MDN5298842.1 two-component system, OmpR family, response regulator RegX3 [Clostridiales bacterium]